MLKPEQVPDEVVEALLDTSNVAQPWANAIAAAINAWPGLNHDSQAWRGYGGEVLILPLTEPRDE